MTINVAEVRPAKAGPPLRIVVLDLLRFTAAVTVMLYHFTYKYADGSGRPLSPLELVTRHGYLGVDVFFIISGFVVLWSAQGRTAAQFLRARVLRLYPEFWIAVLVSAVVFTLTPGGRGEDLTLQDVLLNLTMIPQYLGAPYVDGVYWTLGVELKFYALLGGLVLLRQVGRVEVWLYAWLAVSALATFVNVGGVVRSLTVFPYGPLFASGGLFYLVFNSGWSRGRALGLLIGLALSAHHAVNAMPGFIDGSHISPGAKVVTVSVIAVTFLVFALLKRVNLPDGMAKSLVVLGGLTYPLYLLHNTGKEILLSSASTSHRWPAILAAIGFSMGLSYAVMRLGTGPVRRWLRAAISGTKSIRGSGSGPHGPAPG